VYNILKVCPRGDILLIDKLRFWLSFKLLILGVKVAPDKEVQEWLKYGLKVAGTGIEASFTENESI